MLKKISKKTLMLALAASLFVFVTGVTVAFLKAQSGVLINTFRMGKIDTSIEEEVKVEDGKLLKVVTVKNRMDAETAKSKAFVRVRLTVSPQEAATCDTPAENSGSHWVFNEDDGFWYYTLPLAPEESTEELMTQVQVNEHMTFEEGDTLDVIVYEEACAVTQVDEFDALNKEEKLEKIIETFLRATKE